MAHLGQEVEAPRPRDGVAARGSGVDDTLGIPSVVVGSDGVAVRLLSAEPFYPSTGKAGTGIILIKMRLVKWSSIPLIEVHRKVLFGDADPSHFLETLLADMKGIRNDVDDFVCPRVGHDIDLHFLGLGCSWRRIGLGFFSLFSCGSIHLLLLSENQWAGACNN